MPHSSMSILTPPSEETASTTMSVSGLASRTTWQSALTGFSAPVEVSLWTISTSFVVFGFQRVAELVGLEYLAPLRLHLIRLLAIGHRHVVPA